MPGLQLLEALASFGESGGTPAELAHLLGADPAVDGDDAPGRVVRQLTAHALVWPGPNGRLRMPRTLLADFEQPLGVGPPLEELLQQVSSAELRQMTKVLGLHTGGDTGYTSTKAGRIAAVLDHHRAPQQLARLLESAPPAARKVLEQHAEDGDNTEGPGAIMFDGPRSRYNEGAQWALDRGLLFARSHWWESTVLPAEVLRTLRGSDWHAPFSPTPPEVELAEAPAAEVEREAAAALLTFSGQAVTVLAQCAARPLARLKTGGVDTRELRRLGKAAQLDVPGVRLVLETAYSCGILTSDGSRFAVTTQSTTARPSPSSTPRHPATPPCGPSAPWNSTRRTCMPGAISATTSGCSRSPGSSQ